MMLWFAAYAYFYFYGTPQTGCRWRYGTA